MANLIVICGKGQRAMPILRNAPPKDVTLTCDVPDQGVWTKEVRCPLCQRTIEVESGTKFFIGRWVKIRNKIRSLVSLPSMQRSILSSAILDILDADQRAALKGSDMEKEQGIYYKTPQGEFIYAHTVAVITSSGGLLAKATKYDMQKKCKKHGDFFSEDYRCPECSAVSQKELMDAKGWSDKGASLTASGRHKEAIACYDKALKINPELAIPWHNKAKSLAALGRADEATKCIIRAANLGLDEAQKVCEQSGTLYKKHDLDADDKISQGIALGKLGKWQEALAFYDKALELTPENPKAWINKGRSLAHLCRLPEAMQSFQQFVKYAKPGDAETVAGVKDFIAKTEAESHGR